MKTLDTFINNLVLYNSLPENVQADVNELVPFFRTHLAAILPDCKVDNPGFDGDAHTWTFEVDIFHPGLEDNESVVLGIDFDRESNSVSPWAFVQKDGAQVDGTYERYAPDTEAVPPIPDPVEVIVRAIRKYGYIQEKSSWTPGDCIRLTVTDVDVFPLADGPTLGHIRGFARITLNHQLQVRGLRIMEGDNGLFVGYPVDPFYKGEENRYISCPLTKELRDHIEAVVLDKYRELT